MKNNKLKHSFIEKKEPSLRSWAEREREISSFENQRRELGVIHGYLPEEIEVKPIRTIQIVREVGDNLYYNNRNPEELEMISKAVENDMARELGKLLMESGYTEFVKVVDPNTFRTKWKMQIKVKRLNT
mgnify:CR=1 FL=1|tara:strand:+ start:6341 stop:6727 length:387 start_codon:yes stop_codon:yes gene_type:complete